MKISNIDDKLLHAYEAWLTVIVADSHDSGLATRAYTLMLCATALSVKTSRLTPWRAVKAQRLAQRLTNIVEVADGVMGKVVTESLKASASAARLVAEIAHQKSLI